LDLLARFYASGFRNVYGRGLLPLTLPIHPTSFHLFSIHLILIRIFIFINYNINYIVFQDLILIIHFPIIPSIFPIILIQPAADVPPIINFTSLILTYTYLSISASISVLRMQMQSFPFSRIPPPSPVAPLVSSLTGSPCSVFTVHSLSPLLALAPASVPHHSPNAILAMDRLMLSGH
jgi:hypothetical protein